uniref:2'-phosphotransferase n=1 Tax=Gopherus agassizii TaxID=38772 RepID=A0A452IMH6_9SAUR
MDPEISIMLQCPSPKGLAETAVRAELSPAYNRRQLPGGQAWIDAVWEARCRHSPWLFNGSKFRLHSAQLDGGSLTFCLGLTCYKDFLGTNRAGMARHLQQQGRQDFGDSQAYLAEPLGVGAMVHTANDCFVFLRRSLRVGEAPGLVDIPGGHPEPQAVVGDVPEESIRLQDLPRQMVVKEIFTSILREIRDEVNLPLPTLSQPVLLGIARNQTSAGRASAEFYVRCSLTSEQVKQRYEIGGPEAQESTSIIFIKREDVLTLEQTGEMWRELCPSAKGANPVVHLSKTLSYVLRHGAAQLGLEMGADGFVDVAALLSLPRFGGVSVADVRHVVETNEKCRFALRSHPSDGRLQIRANQGHSLQVSELELIPLLEPTALPQTMVHGTYLRHWPAICRGGLSRMGRNHIHLAPGLPGDGHVLSDGIQFYRSANGVILTPGDAEGLLPPRYFQRVLQLRPDRRLLPLE